MFGYYIPETLTFREGGAVIDFISASDESDVTRVMIGDADHARRVSGALETQKTRGITTMEGDLIDFRGSIAFNPHVRDEALLTPEGDENFGRTIPVKLGFDPGQTQFPRHGFAMGTAVMKEGAMLVYEIAVRSFAPAFDRGHAPAASGQMN